jgi:chromosome segregation ATPase
MPKSRASYLGTIRLQKLAKARAEMELTRLGGQVAAIEEENAALFKMHNDRFEGNAGIVPAHIIMKRLETNKMRQAQLSERMIAERQELAKISRTIDTLDRRLHSLGRELERVQAAVEMDEYMSHLQAKHSI